MQSQLAFYNPVVKIFGGDPTTGTSETGSLLANLIATLWTVLLSLGGIAVLVFLLMGAVNWITAGGDKAKVEAARDRITNAIIGMAILFASMAVVNFLGPAIGFDILNLNLPNNL